MKSVLELLYEQAQRDDAPNADEPDSVYTRMFHSKRENIRALNESLSKEQKELLDAYATADAKTEEIRLFENFRYAFYLGVQLAFELAQKEVLPK